MRISNLVRATLLALLSILLLAGTALASGASEHGVILPYRGAKFVDGPSTTVEFGSYDFMVTDANDKTERITKQGKYWNMRYRITDASGKLDKSVSALEIVENYKNAALQKGGKIRYDFNYRLTFTLPREDGGETWAHLLCGDGQYDIHIVDVKGLKPTLVFGAEEMQSELNLDGVAVIYGIHFAVDSDRLELGAEKVLTEMVKLMQANPALRIEVQGHTDNTGSAAHNLDLSTRRAATVVNFLVMYGIDKSRMTSKGLGLTMPLASNDTEDGRAINRRVELHQLN